MNDPVGRTAAAAGITADWRCEDRFDALIARTGQWLAAVLARGGSAALPGGRTPRALCRHLASLDLPWASIRLLATDERWVDDSAADSNEGMFRRELLAQLEVPPKLVSLKNEAAAPREAVTAVAQRLARAFPTEFDAVLLGMGDDGHVASLFPGAPLNDAADPHVPCLAAAHPQTAQPRISLSLDRLLRTRALALLVSGESKRAVLERAQAFASAARADDLPVTALLRAAHAKALPVQVFWSPVEPPAR
jgi:6-phosphogluconolactonase